MNRQMHLLLAVLLAALPSLATCGPVTAPAPGATADEPRAIAMPEVSIPLEGTEWALTSLRGGEPVAGSSLTLAFYPDNYMEGNAGCNSYGATYSGIGSTMAFEAVISTEMACLDPAGVMEQEAHYLDLLAAVASYHIYGDHLWLETDDGRGLVFGAGLPGTEAGGALATRGYAACLSCRTP